MSSEARAIDRRLLALAIPALFTLAAEPLYVLADTAIVGHIGTTALGGLSLAAIVLLTAAGLCNVLTWWTASRVGFLFGARNHDQIRRVAATVLWLSLALGFFFVVVLVAVATPLLRLLGGDGRVLEEATTYLRIGVLGLPGLLLTWAGQGVARGQGDTRSPLAVVVAANVLNVVLELWFVYGLDAGIAGSAWGTVIAQWAGGVVFAVRLIRLCGGSLRPDFDELRTIRRVSVDLVVRTAALFASLTLASAVAARVGVVSLAAHQVISQLNLFTALALDAAAIAAQALIAEASGAGDAHRRALVTRRAIRLTLTGAALFAVVLVVGARLIPDVFTDDGRVVDEAARVMPLLALTMFPAGFAYLYDGVLMGDSNYVAVRRSTLWGLVAFAVFGGAVLARPSLGLPVIWLGLFAWLTVRAAVNWRAAVSP